MYAPFASITPSPSTISSLALSREPGLIRQQSPMTTRPAPASRPHTPTSTLLPGSPMAVKHRPICMLPPDKCTYQGFIMLWCGPSDIHSGRKKYSAYHPPEIQVTFFQPIGPQVFTHGSLYSTSVYRVVSRIMAAALINIKSSARRKRAAT